MSMSEGMGLIPPFLALTGEIEGTLGDLGRLVHATGQQIGLAQSADPTRLPLCDSHGGGLLNGLFLNRQGLGNAPR